MKNQWIKAKLELDLYLGTAKQCKYLKAGTKKVQKTDNS
jgi:hypothetical protein